MKVEVSTSPSTAILVLGMHRSGTSAATRVLNLLGADLGHDLLAPQQDNLKGFWEHHDAVQIHERLLFELDRNWYDLSELPTDWLEHPASKRAVEEIVALIRREFSDLRLWAVKDPRMCRLVPLWIRALDDLGVNATALIVVRDPREVAASLHARDGWSYEHSWLMWAQHVLESVRATENIPRAMLDYDDLMQDWISSASRIGKELGISWPRNIDEVRSEVEAFLSPVDRHHRVNESKTLNRGASLPRWLTKLFMLCSGITAGRENWSSMVGFLEDYLLHAEIFAGPITELTHQRKKLEQVAFERMDVIREVKEELAAHSKHLKGATAALETKSYELHDLTSQRLLLQAMLDEKLGELTVMTERWANVQKSLDAKSSQLDVLTARCASLESSLQTQSAQMEELSTQRSLFVTLAETRQVEIIESKSELAEVQQSKFRLEEELGHLRAASHSRLWLTRRIMRITLGQLELDGGN